MKLQVKHQYFFSWEHLFLLAAASFPSFIQVLLSIGASTRFNPGAYIPATN